MSFTTSSGASPSQMLQRVADAVTVQEAALLAMGNFLKDKVLARTQRGVDVDGAPFAAYSEKRPYYYNPWTGGKTANWNKMSASTDRLVGKLGGSKRTGIIRNESGKLLGQRSGTGTSVKFESYGAFKRALGRSNVDLTGPRAPHMLQALTVRVLSGAAGFVLGIYGDMAKRARAHQYGNPAKGLPQRRFMGASEDDRQGLIQLLSKHLHGTLNTALKGR